MSWTSNYKPTDRSEFDRWGVWPFYISDKEVMKPKRIMLLGEFFEIRMHAYKAGNNYGKITCPRDYRMGDCCLCNLGDKPSTYYAITVLDMDGYTGKDDVFRLSIKPFYSYIKTTKLIDLAMSRTPKGTGLHGAIFDVTRTASGRSGSSQGDVWSYMGHENDLTTFSRQNADLLRDSLSRWPGEYGFKNGDEYFLRPIDFELLLKPVGGEDLEYYLTGKGWSPQQSRDQHGHVFQKQTQQQVRGSYERPVQPQQARGGYAHRESGPVQTHARHASHNGPQGAAGQPQQAAPAQRHNASYAPPGAQGSYQPYDDDDIPF